MFTSHNKHSLGLSLSFLPSFLPSLLLCLTLASHFFLFPVFPLYDSTAFLYLSIQIYIAYRHLITNLQSAFPSFNLYLKPWAICQPSPVLPLSPSTVFKNSSKFFTPCPRNTHTHTQTKTNSSLLSYQHLYDAQEMFLPRIRSHSHLRYFYMVQEDTGK